MKTFHWVLAACGVLLLAASTSSAADAPKNDGTNGKIRVLLVTGVDYPGHPWKETTPAVVAILKKDPRMVVEVQTNPGALADKSIFDHDVLVMHFKNYDPLPREEEAKANLQRFVREGRGLVMLHFACGAFEKWPEFVDLAGMVWDQKTGHDPRGPFRVEIKDPNHPITQGMKDFQADDELYTCLVGKKNLTIVATSRSIVTKKDHPMAFVQPFGKGRVFHTPLGHDVKAFQMPGVSELIRRGTAWAAGQSPTPK
jgi:type 1 glutamine amidotransferase